MKEFFKEAVSIINPVKEEKSSFEIACAFMEEFLAHAKSLGIIDTHRIHDNYRSRDNYNSKKFTIYAPYSETRFHGHPRKHKHGDFSISIDDFTENGFRLAVCGDFDYHLTKHQLSAVWAEFSSVEDESFKSYMTKFANFAADVSTCSRIVKAGKKAGNAPRAEI